MSSETDLKADRLKVDKVFAEAVCLGAVLREESPVQSWQFDLQSMSFPVARNVVSRFGFYCCIANSKFVFSHSPLFFVIFVTGIGGKRQTGSGLTSLRD